MIGRCVANRPYMYLPLKGDTNDYSVNAQNPTNNNVTTTTGQFGETNGAYEWNSTTDSLQFTAGFADTIRGYCNNNFTYLCFLYPTNLTTTSRVFTGGQFDLGATIQTSGGIDKAFQLYTYQTIITFDTKNSSNNAFTVNTWQIFAITLKDNGSTMDWIAYNNNVVANTTITKPAYDSGVSFSIGNDGNGSSSAAYIGKMHTSRIYSQTLSIGQLSIINNEKGRIRA